MCTNPIPITPDFTKTFIMERDVLGHGIGVVLMQEGSSLAFDSSQLKGKNLLKPFFFFIKMVMSFIIYI